MQKHREDDCDHKRKTITTTAQQYLSLCYHQNYCVHQLTQLGVSWETLIAHESFKGTQIFAEPQEEGEPSRQQKELESKTKEAHIPVFVTYERGTRMPFAVAK